MLTDLPNIGKTLAEKLEKVEICTPEDLKALGSQQALIKIATVYQKEVCLNMLYALEGAVEGIRWHGLDKERKQELKSFYDVLRCNKK